MDLPSLQLDQRIVTVVRDIDSHLAHHLSMQLRYLDALDHSPIHLHISSPGGCVYEGLHIYDVMQLIRSPVHTYCLGMAMSMACVLLAAGEPGHRHMTANATVMMHAVGGAGDERGDDVSVHVDERRRLNRLLAGILARHTGRPVERIREVMARDTFFGSDQARDFGFVDHVLQPAVAPPPRRPRLVSLPGE